MAKKTSKRTSTQQPEKAAEEVTEAQQLVEKLMGWGMRGEEIAFRMRVSLNSIVRWRRGITPWPGHMTTLRELVETVKAERKGGGGAGGGDGSGGKVRRAS